eukprot:1782246-Rhodomonas_salina.1
MLRAHNAARPAVSCLDSSCDGHRKERALSSTFFCAVGRHASWWGGAPLCGCAGAVSFPPELSPPERCKINAVVADPVRPNEGTGMLQACATVQKGQ